MKILLVDDSEHFLIGLQNLLEAADFQVVGTASTAEMALALVRYRHPDVVLMDVQMPGRSGIEATAQIKQYYPSVKVVMMTVSERDEHLFEAIKAGANGYLLKDLTMDGFPEALEALGRGEAPLSPGLTNKVMAEFARRAQKPEEKQKSVPEGLLTPRELVILRWASEGLTYREIAAAMGLSERTIKYNFREIADKLHLENRAQVLAHASRILPKMGGKREDAESRQVAVNL